MSAITVRADEEHRVAAVAKAKPLPQNHFAMNRRHASSQAGLDNGSGSWQVRTSSDCGDLSKVAKHGNPAAPTAGFHLLPAFETRYFSAAQLVDDRTDDCAFGAMMSLLLRPKFRKLRFQMIDDTVHVWPLGKR